MDHLPYKQAICSLYIICVHTICFWQMKVLDKDFTQWIRVLLVMHLFPIELFTQSIISSNSSIHHFFLLCLLLLCSRAVKSPPISISQSIQLFNWLVGPRKVINPWLKPVKHHIDQMHQRKINLSKNNWLDCKIDHLAQDTRDWEAKVESKVSPWLCNSYNTWPYMLLAIYDCNSKIASPNLDLRSSPGRVTAGLFLGRLYCWFYTVPLQTNHWKRQAHTLQSQFELLVQPIC